ncbi:MAG: transketolase [Acidobacteriota bacterium]
MRPFDELDHEAVTALRVFSVDQVEAARSGHPGLPLGAAPMAYALWSRFLRFDPGAPQWPNRDRFVLSAGHGSALLYSLLHVFGYDLPLGELRRFRQLGSQTPGHPEHGLTPGVETTTGPLGQGLATAVGMAIAERHLAARFNREGFPLFDHRTFVLASDGDLMEGISHEAAALAGHLRLGRLVVLHDDNRITIEGPTSLASSEDVGARFAAYGWRVLRVEDGNDLEAIAAALTAATASDEAPALVCVRTHIGYGSPHKQDKAEAHGAPLGGEEAARTRKALGWEIGEPFSLPGHIAAHAHALAAVGVAARRSWDALFARYAECYGEAAGELRRRLGGELPGGWEAALPAFPDGGLLATREASGKVLNALAPWLPELLGGAADLAPSTSTLLAGEADVAGGNMGGRNLRFGVREHAMAAIANGLALSVVLRPYVATFLVFSDYLRPALRLSAMMGLPVIYVFTHDSIAMGEDGPTHQPIEHLAALRAIPNLVVLRPADARETAAAWRLALERRDGPTALILSRQKLPVLPPPPAGAVARGAYVRAEAGNGAPEVVILATGSEVSLALAVRDELQSSGVSTRVVSAPSRELFARQGEDYRKAVLGPGHALKLLVEAGRSLGWEGLVAGGELVTLETYGASAPGEELARRRGFDRSAIAARVRAALAARRPSRLAAAVPATFEAVLEGRRARLKSLHVCQRLRIRDAALWGERFARDVSRRLGWLDAPARTLGELPGLARLVAALDANGARTLYLLGMGGSSLAPQVLRQTLGNPSGRELVVVDTTDPDRTSEVLDRCDPASAAVLVVSKSGTTAETSALTEVFWKHLEPAHGSETGKRFVAITEHATPLERLVAERGFRTMIPHPVDVGGRYAALSVVGAFPSLWLGHDVETLLESGIRGFSGLGPEHPGIELALLLGSAAPTGWGTLAWCASPGLMPLGAWAEQLIAESTGKEGKGILPVLLQQALAPEQSWPDTLYLSPQLAGDNVTELDAALDRLTAAGRLVARWRLDRQRLGEAFAVLEVATAVAGLLAGVNPFDEPDVARAKERARAALDEGIPASPSPTASPAKELRGHTSGLGPQDIVVLLAYLPEDEAVSAALDHLAGVLRTRLKRPVTAAFGPRYLHSTGQLHKGGPDHVVPVVFTAPARRDVQVPGRPYTLGQLRHAQALGDARALADVGRKVLHLHLGADPAAALREIAAAL